jgi:hypothetical protein
MFSFLLTLAVVAPVLGAPFAGTPASTVNCNGKTYIYETLAGFGYVPNTAKDSAGETIGGFGSSAAIDHQTWFLVDPATNQYEGEAYLLPDRGL